MRFTSCLVLLYSLLWSSTTVFAQEHIPSLSEVHKKNGAKALIRNISVSGNKITKDFVIIRELGFSAGDSLPVSNVSATLSRLKYNVLNTKFFNDVFLNIKNWDDEGLDLHVTVVEKWYIIPIPILQLADRNLNEWWVDQNKDLKRIQYGVLVNWNNFRGRGETLNISASLGFAQLIGMNYQMPYLSKNGKLGASIEVHLMRSRRMAYNTFQNKLEFYYSKNFIKKSAEVAPRLLIHPNIYTVHYIEARYSYRWVDAFIPSLNNKYFLNGRNTQSAISLEYGFNIDKRTLKAYPTTGHQIKGSVSNHGLGLQKHLNLTVVSASVSKYFTLDKKHKHSTGHFLKLNASLPNEQPYNLQRGLGYDQDFVRGYEYYVVDGQHYFLAKNEYRYHLGSVRMGANPKRHRPLLLKPLPFEFYLKTFLDLGYVHDRFFTVQNTLHNQLLAGAGIGIDMLMMYDRVLRVEYSLTRDKEHGLFFHLELPF